MSAIMQTNTSYIGSSRNYLPSLMPDPQELDREEVQNRWETILLVEDEAYVRDITQELLEMFGYTVITAQNAVEAIKLFEEYEGVIHLLVTDVVMPGMNGRELSQRLTERCPELKSIFISGYTDNTVIRNGFRNPNTAYLQKPFTLESLARKVRDVIDGKPQVATIGVN